MAEYIEREKLSFHLASEIENCGEADSSHRPIAYGSMLGLKTALSYVNTLPSVEVVRCKDCIYAVELDKHCDISRTAYRHCSLLRGDETKYVWHKYKKYYKDYSIVDLDGFCDSGELKEREGK
jgi:hypothetical protein